MRIRNRHGRALLTYAADWFKWMRARTWAATRQFLGAHSVGLRWTVRFVIGTTGIAVTIASLVLLVGLHHVYFDRTNLPDIEPFARFEFPAIGNVYDTNGQLLIRLAREHRQIMQYGDTPPLSVTRFSPPRTRTSFLITEWTIP